MSGSAGASPAHTAPVFSGDLAVRALERHGAVRRVLFDPPEAFAAARAGQFALLASNRPGAPLLGRPISVVRTDPLEFAFAVVGEGTRLLGEAEAGETVHVTGPLGGAFAGAAAADTIVCDASHFGTLLSLAHERAAAGGPAHLVFVREEGDGARYDDPVMALLRPPLATLEAVTLADLPAALDRRGGAVIAAGARDAVMAVLKAHTAASGAVCEAALQAPMACGLGVCKVCIRPHARGGTMLVCEGPVVPIADAVFGA